jgi:hypothetical protein
LVYIGLVLVEQSFLYEVFLIVVETEAVHIVFVFYLFEVKALQKDYVYKREYKLDIFTLEIIRTKDTIELILWSLSRFLS